MRKALLSGERVEMNLCGDKSQKRMLEVVKELGQGASCIAYQAKCVLNNGSGINVILKECFPSEMSRLGCGNIEWNSDSKRELALERFSNSCKVQCDLMNDEKNINSMTHLIDGIYEANETLYSITDLNHMQTYDKISECSLSDIFTTVLSIAKAVKNYHMNGYLHLDIKPGNILVFNETRELIKLLDFDSVVLKNDVANHDIALSYSYDYASPEQRQGCREKICEATDIYAIGAICFDKIMGRTPEPSDENQFSNWDLDNNPFFRRQSNRSKRLAREIFHKTLSVQPTRRFQSISEMETLLEELISASKRERFLNSTCPVSVNEFIGRKAELEQIHESYEKGAKAVFLCGMGGIGKTELALNYADRYKDTYDVIAFGKYSSSLRSLFNDSSFISIENNGSDLDISEDKNGETRNGFGKSNIDEIRNIVDEKTLLIIDNFDTESDDNLDEVLALDCRVLFTSRFSFEEVYSNSASIRHIDIMPLKRDEQIQMFLKMSEHDFSSDEAKILEKIIDIVQGHTLAITLLAKHYKNGIGTLKEILVDLEGEGLSTLPDINVRHKKDGGIYNAQAYDIMHSVMFMYEFSKNEEYVLSSLALFGLMKLKKKSFVELIGTEYINTVNSLIDRSLIEQREEKSCTVLSMHPLYTELSINEFKPDLVKLPWVEPLCKRLSEIAAAQYRNSKKNYKMWFGSEIECIIANTCWSILENILTRIELKNTSQLGLMLETVFAISEGDVGKMRGYSRLIDSISARTCFDFENDMSLKANIEVTGIQFIRFFKKYDRSDFSEYDFAILKERLLQMEKLIESSSKDNLSEYLMLLIKPIILVILDELEYKEFSLCPGIDVPIESLNQNTVQNVHQIIEFKSYFSEELIRISRRIEHVTLEEKKLLNAYFEKVNMTFDETLEDIRNVEREYERTNISGISEIEYGVADNNFGRDYCNAAIKYERDCLAAAEIGNQALMIRKIKELYEDKRIPDIAKLKIFGCILATCGLGEVRISNSIRAVKEISPWSYDVASECMRVIKSFDINDVDNLEPLSYLYLNAFIFSWKYSNNDDLLVYAKKYAEMYCETQKCWILYSNDDCLNEHFIIVSRVLGDDAVRYLACAELEFLQSQPLTLDDIKRLGWSLEGYKKTYQELKAVFLTLGDYDKVDICSDIIAKINQLIATKDSNWFSCRHNSKEKSMLKQYIKELPVYIEDNYY